jgi:hypothetical protein
MDGLYMDLATTLRGLRHRPGFVASVVEQQWTD